jgi:hypothetical protein
MTAEDTRALIRLATVQEAQGEKLDEILIILRGKENGGGGMILRVDRLEQKQASRTKALWVAVGGVILLAAKGVWNKVTGGAP